jgi:hypothetical protein
MLENSLNTDGKVKARLHPLLRPQSTPTSDYSLCTWPNFTQKWSGILWAKTRQKQKISLFGQQWLQKQNAHLLPMQ